jgi:alkylhydroperoxidase/carboxymuconolactone decarboxylase family protein YurZ
MSAAPATQVDISTEQSAMLDTVARFQPGIRKRFELRAKLDPAFAHAYLRYAARLLGRPMLDTRTRLLVMTGQFTMSRRHARLRETFVAAIALKLDMKEVLEVMLQCAIYGGESILDEPLEIFAEEQGATPREVLEVLLQSVLVVGHPNVVPERIRDLVAIVKEMPGASF